MARAMFEYTKTVLEKVSFNPTLFCKEFQKAVERLLPFEIEELMIWMKPMLLQHPELATCVPLLPK
ncbi:hypothetical protein FNJ87_10570 [Nonlabens mediterrranea]|uniref:Uncharacterized protein n=2 Tax=Nonlabens mediterrranea TaxID=1419947 RepID=A0ABS0A7A2_9FLAO|nr:hypothetical protein [Nonlabens ulvanivorans]MBF4984759.1 hypothetical protein [Nonlabens mediterrranea]WOI23979.1 hypothetical protein R1T42_05860 [Nonlabens ulvanivorans]